MFCKATLLTVAFALLASATPVAREPSPASGISIPLQKRGSLKNVDGTFNHEKAVREIVKLKKCAQISFLCIVTAKTDRLPRFTASIART